jgi:hypothetical protein
LEFWQKLPRGKRELNPQPLVRQTNALPLSYFPPPIFAPALLNIKGIESFTKVELFD